MTAAVDECWGGYYCPAGQSSPNPTEYICPQGMHCPNGSATYQVRRFVFNSTSFNPLCTLHCIPISSQKTLTKMRKK